MCSSLREQKRTKKTNRLEGLDWLMGIVCQMWPGLKEL